MPFSGFQRQNYGPYQLKCSKYLNILKSGQEHFEKYLRTKTCSSLIGRSSYLGFYIDWLLELIAVAADAVTLAINGSICVGIFLYINGMVDDMKTRISLAAAELHPLNTWAILESEIRLHVEIIK